MSQLPNFVPSKKKKPFIDPMVLKLASSSITAKTSRVEEGDTTLQKTEQRCRCSPSKVASYTFHRQINK